MRVALLISGYLRTFNTNLPTIKKKILDKFETVDVYIHITEGSDDRYLNNITNDDMGHIRDVLKPITTIREPNLRCSEDEKANNTINTWFKYHKLNQLKKDNEFEFGIYDLVIKYRPDMDLLSYEIPSEIGDYVHIPSDSKIDKDKLSNEGDEYLCDIFAYGKSGLMDEYFSIYENIDTLIDEHGSVSETLVYHHLTNNKIPYKVIDIDYNVILSSCNVFAIAGDSGSGKTTLGNILKKYFSDSLMLECDRYHKWERGDENWSRLTHLNPEANYLTKMNEDLFDLKIGKDVYQVDYDHKNGRFTEKEHIESSDNIIVCGLHSLYVENDTLYNLKIFIDTDMELKKKWKINRDVVERGYSMEKVMKQIETRESDFMTHIYPQRDKSDMVINFHEVNGELHLKLSIKSSYELVNIISKFVEMGIPHNVVVGGGRFNDVTFTKHTPLNTTLSNHLELKEYYDYILYFILNLK